MTQLLAPPAAVLAAYSFDTRAAAPLAGGLINDTFAIRSAAGTPEAILQRLHPIFGAEVNDDIDAITAHLAAAGLETPRLVTTLTGARWVAHDNRIWRALTYVPGYTLHRFSPDMRVDPIDAIRSAGRLVGRFHRATSGLTHRFAFTRAGVHDTSGFLARLHNCITQGGGFAQAKAAAALGQKILDFAGGLPPLGDLPVRICHGDLKVSNIVFRDAEAVCLIDLDTLSLQTIAYELGDALRSWANPAGEDVTEPALDTALYTAAIAGYEDEAGDLLSADERGAIVPGIETVCAELAARFCIDVFDDAYFGWDSTRFASRRDHNLIRAQGQLALGHSVRSQLRP